LEEDIKNDLSSIAFSHPFFRDIVGNTLNYIEKLEQENNNYKAAALKNDDYYKEVCNKNKELEKKYDDLLCDVYDLFVRKSLIKEKIEELNKEIEELQERFNKTKEKEFCNAILVQIKSKRNTIKVLQELLGDEK